MLPSVVLHQTASPSGLTRQEVASLKNQLVAKKLTLLFESLYALGNRSKYLNSTFVFYNHTPILNSKIYCHLECDSMTVLAHLRLLKLYYCYEKHKNFKFCFYLPTTTPIPMSDLSPAPDAYLLLTTTILYCQVI